MDDCSWFITTLRLDTETHTMILGRVQNPNLLGLPAMFYSWPHRTKTNFRHTLYADFGSWISWDLRTEGVWKGEGSINFGWWNRNLDVGHWIFLCFVDGSSLQWHPMANPVASTYRIVFCASRRASSVFIRSSPSKKNWSCWLSLNSLHCPLTLYFYKLTNIWVSGVQ